MNRLMTLLYFTLLAANLLAATNGAAQAGGPPTEGDPTGGEVAFDQKLDTQLPLDTAFVDERGRPVRLGDYFGGKPVVLLFAYYNCPMLCSLVWNDLAQTMRGLTLVPGKEFEIVTVSIDPTDTPELASQKKAAYLAEYGKPGADAGWHFLTGQQPEIERLAGAAGFQYYFDEQLKEYAHPTGLLLLTPEGRVSRYLLGIDYSPLELRMGLVEASARKIGKPVIDTFYLLCYQYDPQHGRYTLAIQNFVRLAGGIFVAGLGLLLFTLARSDRGRAGPAEPRWGRTPHG